MMKGKWISIPGFKNQLMVFSERFSLRKLVTTTVRKMSDKGK